MSLFTFISDTRATNKLLARIADALDRLAPPEQAPVARTPAAAEDITYASDEASARQELLDELGRYEQEMKEHEEGGDNG